MAPGVGVIAHGLIDFLIVSGVLAVVFVAMPRIMFDRPHFAEGRTDRLIIDVVRMGALIATLTLVFVPTRLFQLAAFVMVAIASVYFLRLRPRGLTIVAVLTRWARVGDASLYIIEATSPDGNEVVQRTVREWWEDDVKPAMRPRAPRLPSRAALARWAPLAAIAGSLGLSALWWPLTHLSLRSGDAYVHLSWTKRLAGGELFRDGVNARGLHGIVGYVQDLGPASTFDVFRFGGPIMAVATVLVAYALGRRATIGGGFIGDAHLTGLLAAASAAGLLWGADFSGMAALNTLSPIDVSAFFGLCTSYLMLGWLEAPSGHRLLTAAAGVFVVAVVDPVGLGIPLLVAAAAALALSAERRSTAPLLRVFATIIASAAIGSVYWLARFFPGIGGYHSSHHLNPLAGGSANALGPEFSAPLLAALAVFLIAGLAASFLTGERHATGPTAIIGAALLACVAALAGPSIAQGSWASALTSPALALAPVGVVAAGIALARTIAPLLAGSTGLPSASALTASGEPGLVPISRSRPRRSRPAAVVVAAALAIAPALAVAAPVSADDSASAAIEYEAAARTLDEIIRQHTTLSYTVVGPPAWEDRVQANGFHIQLTDFVDKLTLRNAADPGFVIPLFTDRVFIMAEKRPFPVSGSQYLSSIVGERYYQPESRAQLMRDVITFMDAYTRSHDGQVRVAYEDDDLVVWAIKQRADQEYALRFGLADPQFAPDCGPVAVCK